jgi:hypothetical protein
MPTGDVSEADPGMPLRGGEGRLAEATTRNATEQRSSTLCRHVDWQRLVHASAIAELAFVVAAPGKR